MIIKRDLSLDILRGIALLCIILIHTSPSSIFLQQIRNFDVPLMVFLSGVSYILSCKKKSHFTYRAYFLKRFKRLILPTWIFLLIYFSFYHIVYFFFPVGENNFPPFKMFKCFVLMTDWYVWIIRIFFIIALVAPIIGYVSKRNYLRVLLTSFFTLFIFEFIPLNHEDSLLYYLGMTLPYIAIFSLGQIAIFAQRKSLLILSSIFFITYLFLAYYYYCETQAYQLTSIAKYPPKLYYTSYALAFTLFLFVFREQIYKYTGRLKMNAVMTFIGSHTLWIYFWHIIILLPALILPNFFIKFIVVVTLSTFITYLQVKLVNRILSQVQNPLVKKNLSILFLG